MDFELATEKIYVNSISLSLQPIVRCLLLS